MKTVKSLGAALGDVNPEIVRVIDSVVKLPVTLSLFALPLVAQEPVKATDTQDRVPIVKLEARLTTAEPEILLVGVKIMLALTGDKSI